MNSTDPQKTLVVDTVPAILHVNGLSLFFAIPNDKSNFYFIKDHHTGLVVLSNVLYSKKLRKHYHIPNSVKTFAPTKGYEGAKLQFRFPILTNSKDNFFKKYR